MQLHYQRFGEGAPLLILHGLFGSLDNWQTVSRLLGESYQAISVDLRNHGRSPHSEAFGYEVMAEDLLELMTSRKLPKISLLGHSMGGKLAMHFALNHPELVEKLIVVDMAPREYPPLHADIFKALLSVDLTQFRERHEVESALAPAIPQMAVRNWLLKNIGRDDQGGLKWKMNLPVIHRNYSALNQAIPPGKSFPGPVLFIKGGQSDYIQESDIPLILPLFPRTTFKTITGAGHWVHAEAPEALVTFVKRFMR